MTTVDHEQCKLAWCLAHKACDCAYAQDQPHTAASCRYHQSDRDIRADQRRRRAKALARIWAGTDTDQQIAEHTGLPVETVVELRAQLERGL